MALTLIFKIGKVGCLGIGGKSYNWVPSRKCPKAPCSYTGQGTQEVQYLLSEPCGWRQISSRRHFRCNLCVWEQHSRGGWVESCLKYCCCPSSQRLFCTTMNKWNASLLCSAACDKHCAGSTRRHRTVLGWTARNCYCCTAPHLQKCQSQAWCSQIKINR